MCGATSTVAAQLRRRLAFRPSLRAKIITWSIVPTAIILAVVAWGSFYAYRQMTEDLVIERDQELTRIIARELARELTADAEVLTLLARPQGMRDSLAESFATEQVGSIVRPRIGKDGRAYLVNENGRLLYHSGAGRIGDDISKQPAVQMFLAGEMGAIRTHNAKGQAIVASFAPVPGTDWGLITEESWDELIRSSQTYRHSLLLLLALGVLAPLLAITVGMRRITYPIIELIHASQKVAGGDFDQTIHVSSGDELEELAEQFNHMAAQLQESYRNLERKVADRTKELATLNAVASSVNESLDLDQTLNRALDELLELLNLEVGEIRLLDDDRNELVVRTQRGLSDEFVRTSGRCKINDTLPGQVLQTGQLLICEDVRNDPHPTWAQEEGLRAVVICPLQVKEKPLGTLCLATRLGSRSFDRNERELLRAVSDQVGVAVENARLYNQARQLAVIEERTRLARDLHDSVTQSLYGVTLFAEATDRLLSIGDTKLAHSNLRELRDTAQEALREMRLLIFELRPQILGDNGLAAALQARLEAVEGRAGLETTFQTNGEDLKLLPEIEEGLYRIAQETLNNALKHAHARHINVFLRQAKPRVVLEITDDGVGFDPAVAREQGGFGLCGMEERAAQLGAELSIKSWPGEGTQVKVEVYQ